MCVCVFFFLLVIEIRGLCQEGRPTEKNEANIRSGAPRREQPEGLCALNFSLGFVFICFQPHIRAGMRRDVSSSEALGDTGVV